MTLLASFFGSLKQVPPLLAAITLATLARGWWQKTLGRRRLLRRNFQRLAVGMRPDAVKELFGEPKLENQTTGYYLETRRWPWRHRFHRREVALTMLTWELGRHGYLVTWSEGEQVVAYSLTTASRWFAPKLPIGPAADGRYVCLGRSRFAQVATNDFVQERLGWLGARRYGYWEMHYWGNPGHYQNWYLGYSQCGYVKHRARPPQTETEGCTEETIQEFRRSAYVNSILITRSLPTLEIRETGPHGDLVRLTVQPTWRQKAGVRMRWAQARVRPGS
ncbi:ETEC_3214 domain-containing protein [Streptomyces olivoreticuli]